MATAPEQTTTVCKECDSERDWSASREELLQLSTRTDCTSCLQSIIDIMAVIMQTEPPPGDRGEMVEATTTQEEHHYVNMVQSDTSNLNVFGDTPARFTDSQRGNFAHVTTAHKQEDHYVNLVQEKEVTYANENIFDDYTPARSTESRRGNIAHERLERREATSVKRFNIYPSLPAEEGVEANKDTEDGDEEPYANTHEYAEVEYRTDSDITKLLPSKSAKKTPVPPEQRPKKGAKPKTQATASPVSAVTQQYDDCQASGTQIGLSALVDLGQGQVARDLLPKPQKQPHKCSRRHVYALCVDRQTRVIMVSKISRIGKGPANKLTVFNPDGSRKENTVIQHLHVSLALPNQHHVIMADKANSEVYSTTIDRIDLKLQRYVKLKRPVLSKAVPGDKVYVIGKNDEAKYEIRQVNFPVNTNPGFTIVYHGLVDAFDVSSDGQYFAVVSREGALAVDIFKKDQEQPFTGFISLCEGGDGDVCFYTPRRLRHEVLVVADYQSHRLVLLDHTKRDCPVLGETCLPYPARLARDSRGRLWVASDWLTEGQESAKLRVFPY